MIGSPVRDHQLFGARPEPLASYLKGLGVLRLVAEQTDPEATGRWSDDGFVLGTTLTDDQLTEFFLERYRPTPVLSPWNSSSGFGPEGKGELHTIEASTSDRLDGYRKAADVARGLLVRFQENSWGKEQQIAAARAEMPDAAVAWIDAAVVLSADDQLFYPPLLGTGGNLGRLELSRNFHRRVLDVLGLAPTARKQAPNRAAWLDDALWDLHRSSGLRGESIGQFDPGATGGVNSDPSGSADAVLNPWDFVLLIEGAILFASGSSRRLSAGASARAAIPFTVDNSPEGYPSGVAGETGRGELWAPLWQRPVGLTELRRLFAEGRAEWRGRQARTGLDAAKAAGSLGVDRGVSAFARYAFVERLGQSQAAVAAGRIAVRERPEVLPLADLDRWLERIRRAGNAPGSVGPVLRAVERAQFSVTSGAGPAGLAQVLIEAARLETIVGRTGIFRRQHAIPPVGALPADRWVPALLGGSIDHDPELRLALALASQHDLRPDGRLASSLRSLLRPIGFSSSGIPEWADQPRVEGFGVRGVVHVLADAHVRRVLQVLDRRAQSGDAEMPGVPTAWDRGLPVPLADVADLVDGSLDEDLLGELLAGCVLLDWQRLSPIRLRRSTPGGVLPPALTLLGPFYARRWRSDSANWRARLADVGLRPEASWPALLAAGSARPTLVAARRRLQIAGFQPVVRAEATADAVDGPTARRLGAALLARLSITSRIRLLQAACPDPALTEPPTTRSEETSVAQP